MRNLLENPHVGLLFLIPGLEETLRVNGRAWIVRDEEILARCSVQGKRPTLGIGVYAEECFIHCAKAFKRSGLWQPDRWPDRAGLASPSEMLVDQARPTDMTVPQMDRSSGSPTRRTSTDRGPGRLPPRAGDRPGTSATVVEYSLRRDALGGPVGRPSDPARWCAADSLAHAGGSRQEECQVERKQASEFPQELLDLFHEYQHGEITRRDFFDRASKFAVGGLTVTAIWESLKPNYAWAQQVPKDDPRIATSYETVPSPAGNGSIKGLLARPAKAAGKLPAVLVIHENRGLNPYIEDVARRLAVLEFVAFAPDGLTSVGGYPGDDEKAAAAFRTVDGAKMAEDFVASAKWLKARPESSGKLGAVGFCFGGGIVNQLAVRVPELDAGAPFYGRQPSADAVPQIKAPLLLHYAGNDQGAQRRDRRPSRRRSRRTTRPTTLYIYDGTQHGFHNDTTPRYDENAAKLAWQRTVDFFNKTLRA